MMQYSCLYRHCLFGESSMLIEPWLWSCVYKCWWCSVNAYAHSCLGIVAQNLVDATGCLLTVSAWFRKKRKWDQPAEPLVSAGVAGASGVFPLGNIGSLAGISLPGIASVSGAFLTNQFVANCAPIPPVYQVPSIPQTQSNATVVPKSDQVSSIDYFSF